MPLGRGGRIAQASAVRGSAKVRRELGGDQVEGRQAVRELLAARRRVVHEVWMMEGSDPAAILREIQSLARASHVPVRLVTQRQIQQAQGSEAPQGVIAFAEPLSEADLTDLVGLAPGKEKPAHPALTAEKATVLHELAGSDDQPGLSGEELAEGAGKSEDGSRAPRATKTAFLVVVDGVTDPQNLGALLRSAECAGVTGIVLPRHRSAHVTPTVTKVAAGALEHVPIAVVPGVPGALQELERLGVWTVGLDERGSETLFGLSLGDRPIALVIGAEGRGLAPLARQRCDVLARIPLHGAIDSLNVAAAGAVAMFEVVRQRSVEPG
jgi:23S rRNA (guanosine2251-2'-O)-methyltransferase